MATRVGDMSVEELRAMIREELLQALEEVVSNDPDMDLEMREDFMDSMRQSLQQANSASTIPAESVATKLGLSW
jgi:hypothetical protein